jgi:hypothetical protein
VTHVSAILSLVQKETWRIARTEVYGEPQIPFGGDRLQTCAGIANDQGRRFAMFAFRRNQSRKDSLYKEPDRAGPGLQFFEQLLAGQDLFERDQNVAPEAFDPAMLNSAKPVRVSAL